MNKIIQLESLFQQHGYSDFKWMDPKDIVVAQWVRMKCLFGCDEYGKTAKISLWKKTNHFVFSHIDIHETGVCKHLITKRKNQNKDFVFCKMTLSH